MVDNKLKRKFRLKQVISAVLIASLTVSVPFVSLDNKRVAQAAQAAEATVTSISAYYTGDSVLVGEEIDVSKLNVTVTYSDGVTDELKDYSLASKVVTAVGNNTFTVFYKGKVATFYVYGKTLKKIYANYTGSVVSVGNTIAKSDVYLMVEYSDGTMEQRKDFKVASGAISKEGENTVTVTYKNLYDTFKVLGMAPKQVTSLFASYNGNEVAVGTNVAPEDLIITAVYKDGSTEIINNYVLEPSLVPALGEQTIAAIYQGQKVTFKVKGVNPEIVSIKAEYIGDAVAVGQSVRRSDIIVTATYNNGTTSRITDFSILSSTITYVGYHTITVEVNGLTYDILVQGTEKQNINFGSGTSFSITNGTDTAKVDIALPKNVKATAINGTSLESYLVSRVLSRSVKKSNFIAFEIELTDEDVIEEFPLTLKLTVPTGFDLAYCSLYFTPNRKSVIGKMNTEILGKDAITCEIFHPGTYIFSYTK